MQRYSSQTKPFPSKNNPQYGILDHRTQSLYRTGTDLCRNIKFCDPKTVWPIDTDFASNFYLIDHRSRKMIYCLFDKSRFQGDVSDYIFSKNLKNFQLE